MTIKKMSEGNLTKALINEISQLATHSGMGLMVLDRDPTSPALPDELELIKYCAGAKQLKVNIWLVFSASTKQDALDHFKLRRAERLGEIDPAVVKAAGAKAHIQPKLDPSAFKDTAQTMSGPATTLGTALTQEMRKSGVKYLIVTGTALHACVRATIIDAVAAGFKVLTAATVVKGFKASLKGEVDGWLDIAKDPEVTWYARGKSSADLATFS